MAEEAPIELRKEDCPEPTSIQPEPSLRPPSPPPCAPQPPLSSVLPLTAPILPPDPSDPLLPPSILANIPILPPTSTAPVNSSPPAPPELPLLEETLLKPDVASNETLPPQTGEHAQVHKILIFYDSG